MWRERVRGEKTERVRAGNRDLGRMQQGGPWKRQASLGGRKETENSAVNYTLSRTVCIRASLVSCKGMGGRRGEDWGGDGRCDAS